MNSLTTKYIESLSSTKHFQQYARIKRAKYMLKMTSSNGNIFRVTGLLWGEFTDPRWIPRTKASDMKLWCFLWSVPEQTAEQTIEAPVIWDATVLIITPL